MPREDDSWFPGALAAQNAYQGDFPDEDRAPTRITVRPQSPMVLEPPKSFDDYLEEATQRPVPPPPQNDTWAQQAKAGALQGLRNHLWAFRSPMDELTGADEPGMREARLAALDKPISRIPEPQDPAGRYTRAVMGAIANPSNYIGVTGPAAGATWAALSGAGSETLGHAYKGTKAEPYMRALGGFTPMAAERAWAASAPLVQKLPAGVGALGGRAGGGRRPPPPRSGADLAPNPRAVMGGNQPPEPMGSLAESPPPAMTAETSPAPGAIADQSWAAGLPRPRPAAQSTDIPSIRGLPVDEAIAIARTQPHLIPSGKRAEGYYVGGPRDIKSKRQLTALRNRFDDYIAADPRGGDWYERYRPALNLSTGGVPEQNQMAAAQHGQWSAGVDPNSELGYVLKELNSSIAGMPERANYTTQHEAHLNAIKANDPSKYMLGDKTAEYADQIARGLPGGRPLIPGATGVNDFRFARSWDYTEPSGEPQKGSPGAAAHRFIDMETALAVDRANRTNLGGRSDWTGEQLQAAPWVRQKALDIQERGGKNEDGTFKISYEEAFQRANRTIADFFPSKTYNATYEAQPGPSVTGHMSASVEADEAARRAYFEHPGSTWATAPMGRDAIYAGLRTPSAPGNAMRVLPSVPYTGMYKTPAGTIETNPGEVAQPMGMFNTPHTYEKDFVGPRDWEPFKRTTAADRAIMDAGEHFRAWMDAQDAGAWHKAWLGGPAKESNTLFYPKDTGKPVALGDLFSMQARGVPHGLGDVTDSAQGSFLTRFWPPLEGKGGVPQFDDPKAFNKAVRGGEFTVPGMQPPLRARLDSSLASLVDEWKQGEGSGAATRKMLEYVDKTPELRAAFNDNPYLAERALAKFERDKDWAGKWGAPRQDIQNARQIVAAGPGWIDRLYAALKDGSVSLPAVAALLTGAAALHQQGQQEGAGHARQ